MSKLAESIEVTAANIEDATVKAASLLGVTIDQVEVEVLEEIRKLFGRRQVKVKASIKKLVEKFVPENVAEEGAKYGSDLSEEDNDGKKKNSQVSEEVANNVAVLANEFFENTGLSITVKLKSINGKYVNLELDGKDVSFLIGKYGNGLNGVQYLLNKISGKRIGNFARIVLDGNNFRNKREQALKKLAAKISKEVKSRGEEAVLDAMPAFDRRVIHQCLQNTKGIKTYSEGEDPHRRLVIAPE